MQRDSLAPRPPSGSVQTEGKSQRWPAQTVLVFLAGKTHSPVRRWPFLLGKARDCVPPGGHACSDLPLGPDYQSIPATGRGSLIGGLQRLSKQQPPPPHSVQCEVGPWWPFLSESLPLDFPWWPCIQAGSLGPWPPIATDVAEGKSPRWPGETAQVFWREKLTGQYAQTTEGPFLLGTVSPVTSPGGHAHRGSLWDPGHPQAPLRLRGGGSVGRGRPSKEAATT